MAKDHRTTTIYCLSVATLSVVALAIGLYAGWCSLVETRGTVLRAHQAVACTSELRSILKDSETGQRGFIITGNRDYLKPFYDSRKALPTRLVDVQGCVAGDPTEEQYFKELKPLIDLKEEELNRTVELRQDKGFDAAAAVVRDNSGQKYMDSMRGILEKMVNREQDLLNQRTALLHRKTNYVFGLFSLLFVAGTGLFLAIAYFMRREMRELKKAYASLNEHKNRLEEFYAILGHEMRTPITSIKGSISLIMSGMLGQIPAESSGMLNICRSESDRMLRLINELLDLKKIEEGELDLKMVLTESGTVVSKTIDGIRGMAQQAQVNLVEQTIADVPIKCDEDRIVQVLTNLISNAIKFSPPDTNIELDVEQESSGVVKFLVRDHGPGIAEEDRQKMFQKFYQVEGATSAFKGTGLGLAISKSIAEVHGGSIGFESEIGKGSTFWLVLPTNIAA